jgi:hypothetical protein
MIEILTSAVGVMLLAVSAVLLGALVVFLPDLLQEGMPRWRREVVLVLTWASALATALVSLVAGWALVTALKLEEAPLPRPAELSARTEATVPETTSAEGTIPEVTSDRTGSPSAASSSSASPSTIPSSSASP